MIAHSWSDPPLSARGGRPSSRSRAPRLSSHGCSWFAAPSRPKPSRPSSTPTWSPTRGNGVTVLVDLASPWLDAALDAGPDVVKLDRWQLAEFTARCRSRRLARRSRCRARSGGWSGPGYERRRSRVVLRNGRAWELIPPRFEGGAARAAATRWSERSRPGSHRTSNGRTPSASGRRPARRTSFAGLGTGSGEVVRDLIDRVGLRALRSG